MRRGNVAAGQQGRRMVDCGLRGAWEDANACRLERNPRRVRIPELERRVRQLGLGMPGDRRGPHAQRLGRGTLAAARGHRRRAEIRRPAEPARPRSRHAARDALRGRAAGRTLRRDRRHFSSASAPWTTGTPTRRRRRKRHCANGARRTASRWRGEGAESPRRKTDCVGHASRHGLPPAWSEQRCEADKTSNG